MTNGGTARFAEGGQPPDSRAAIVIGSGFGGSVSALRLAEAGLEPLVLERGPRRGPDDFPRTGKSLPSWLWTGRWNGFFDLRMFRRMATLGSSGVGGGSHIYANVLLRAPDSAFAEGWPRGIDRSTLDPAYQRAERILGVESHPREVVLEKTQAYVEAGRRAGWEPEHPPLAVFHGPRPDGKPAVEDLRPIRDPYNLGIETEQTPCRYCGECDVGCPYGSKNTLDLNYLAMAEQLGATVQPLSEALAIRRERDGYQVHYRDRATGEQRSAWAPRVVVAAGTVSTVELLLRCRDEHGTLPDLSPALGQHFSGNGDFLAMALNTAERLDPWHGTVITTSIPRSIGGRDYYIQEGGFPPDLAFVIAAFRPTSEYASKLLRGPISHAARLRWFYEEVARLSSDREELARQLPANSMIFLAMGQDSSDGQLSLKRRLGRRPKLDIAWEHENSRPLFDAMEADLRTLCRELGGEYVANPLWSALGRLITVHPLGGAALADDREDGVLKPSGEVWGYPGLYVADGAAIPRAVGPNPALTIAAVAEHINAEMSRR